MSLYKITTGIFGQELIFKEDESIWIPTDPENRHYQQYLAWLEEGNEPENYDDSI